jgi:hypothetical protein
MSKIAIACFFISSYVASAQQLLLAVHPSESMTAVVEPIGFFDNDLRFSDVPNQCENTPGSVEFFHTFLEGKARYNIYSNGGLIGEGVVPEKQEPDSQVISVSGSLINGGLASNQPMRVKGARPVLSLTKADQIRLRNVAVSLLSRRHVTYAPNQLRTAQMLKFVSDDRGTVLFAGAFEVVQTNGDLPVSKAAVFFIATPQGDSLKPTYTWFHRPIRIDDSRMLTVFNYLDLNSDGVDELILELDFYENRRFLVLRRKSSRFEKLFETQTIGCL